VNQKLNGREREDKPAASRASDVLLPHPSTASVHVRAFITWVAIFPLVAIGIEALAVLAPQWHPFLRAFVLTSVVVPIAVYFVVPYLLLLERRLSGAVRAARARRRSGPRTTDRKPRDA